MMMMAGLVAVVALGVVAWLVYSSSKATHNEGPSPEETLKQRYARGEIDDAEFERRMSALHH